MARLFLFLLCFVFCFYSFSQKGNLIEIPLYKSKTVGPLGSTVFLLQEGDSNSIFIPEYFKKLVKKNTIQVKYFDFDFDKKLYNQYKSGKISTTVFRNRFTRAIEDTIYYSLAADSIEYDDRIYFIDGIDEGGNYIAIVDLNNNNIFDDEMFWFAKSQFGDSSKLLISETVIKNIRYVSKDHGVSKSFHVALNFKNNKNIRSITKDRRLITLEYYDSYFGSYQLSGEVKINVYLRPVVPSESFQTNNIILYLNKDTGRTPSLFANDKPYDASDTISIDNELFSINKESSSYDTLVINKRGNSDSRILRQAINKIIISETNILTRKKIDTALLDNKYLLIDFWGTWCIPCIENIPRLAGLYKKMNLKKIVFIGVAYDDIEKGKIIKEIALKHNIKWPQILENKNEKSYQGLIHKFRIFSYPTYVVISPEGNIVLATSTIDEVISFLKKVVSL